MKLTFQQRVQRLKPEMQQRFVTEQQEAFEKTEFNSELVNSELDKYRVFALLFESPISTNCDDEYFIELSKLAFAKHTIKSMLCTLSAFQKRTRMEYIQIYGSAAGCDYDLFLLFKKALTVEVNELIHIIEETIIRKLEVNQRIAI